MNPLRLVFMGTPDFAVPTLAALLDAGHDIACVYTQPPRPAGRGKKDRPSPVQAFAEARDIPVRTPKTLRGAADQEAFAALDTDAAIVAAYGLILPTAVLVAPRMGCFNVHASLLPRWRGAAPIQRAILAGDSQSGITIIGLTEGLDEGPMYLADSLPIGADTTAGDLHDGLAAMGARLMVETLDGLAAGTISPVAQPEDGITYARKVDKAEARLDWFRPAVELERIVRAFAPWPGAFLEHAGRRLKVARAEVVDGTGAPGTVLDDRLTIACGDGALRLLTVQKAGKAPMDAEVYLRGNALPKGSVLDPCPATS